MARLFLIGTIYIDALIYSSLLRLSYFNIKFVTQQVLSFLAVLNTTVLYFCATKLAIVT